MQPDKIIHCLLLLLSRFSRVRLCATPEMAAHQAPPSLGFSRTEQWSGLPFPSPMHESEKWKCESEVTQSCPTLSDPMDCSPPGSSVHGIFQARVYKNLKKKNKKNKKQTKKKGAAATKLLQLCPTLCDPRDGSPPGSPIPGILQARTLECVARKAHSRFWRFLLIGHSMSYYWTRS